MINGLVISAEKFRNLTPGCQNELLEVLGLVTPAPSLESRAEATEDWPTKLSSGQAREFWAGLGKKTRAFLKVVLEEPPKFNVGRVLKRVGLQYGDLRGMLAGTTKRIRTVTGNDDAQLFEAEVIDDDINKCVSFMHPDTRSALRQILKMS
jgi:hypothetical protein